MEAIAEGPNEVLRWLASSDSALIEIALRTLLVAGSATALAALGAIPAAHALAGLRFRGRTLAVSLLNTGLGLPPVIVGLVVWLLLVRSGPFGALDLVYTQRGMIAAQTLLAFPVITALALAAFQAVPAELRDLLRVLGAGRLQRLGLLAVEARLGLAAALISGFGAAISEVGASMIVGGNLQGSTRLLTTAIVTETSRGQNARAIAYGCVLLGLAFVVTGLLTILQQRGRMR